MEVESWGNKQDTEYRFKCNNCGCKFRFKRSEIFDEINFFGQSIDCIKCPQCDTKKFFYGSDLRDYRLTKFDKFIALIKNGFKTCIKYMFRRNEHE